MAIARAVTPTEWAKLLVGFAVVEELVVVTRLPEPVEVDFVTLVPLEGIELNRSNDVVVAFDANSVATGNSLRTIDAVVPDPLPADALVTVAT